MAFVPVANTAQFELRMLLDSQKVENTLMFGRGFPITVTQMDAFNLLLANWWATYYAPVCSTSVRLNEVYATDLSSAIAPTASYVPPTAITGADTSPALPNSVSLCVSFRTANRGRSYRGRNYFLGLTEASVAMNDVASGVEAAILTAYEQLISLGTGTGWTWYVVSRFSGVGGTPRRPIPRAAGVRTPVSAVVIVDPTIDSARRRLPGRGR